MSDPHETGSTTHPAREKILELLGEIPDSDRKPMLRPPAGDMKYLLSSLPMELTDDQKIAIETRLEDQTRLIPKDGWARLADFVLRPTLRRTKIDLVATESSRSASRGDIYDDGNEQLVLTEDNITGTINLANETLAFGPDDSVIILDYYGIPADSSLPGNGPHSCYKFLKRDGRLVRHFTEGEGQVPVIEGIEDPELQLRVLLQNLDLFEWDNDETI